MANPEHLAKARQGAEAWNTWRQENPDIIIELSNTDFTHSDNSGISFADFHFGDGAHFYGSKFGDNANFSGAKFGDSADFYKAIFGYAANSFKAKLENFIDFSDTVWGDQAYFHQAQFGNGVNFSRVQFGNYTIFSKVKFDSEVYFSEAQFQGLVYFFGTMFGDDANFSEATFRGRAIFSADSDVSEEAHFAGMSFENVTFHDLVGFSNRRFLGESSFRHTTFEGVPFFHNCHLHQDTDFFGAKFLDIQSPGAARAYRTLKLAMKQQGATDEAHRFFVHELNARQKEEWQDWWSGKQRLIEDQDGSLWQFGKDEFRGKKILKWWVWCRALLRSPFRFCSLCAVGLALQLYGWFSDYGRSLLRPLLVWLAVWVGAYGLYSSLLNPPFLPWNGDIAAFALSRGLPFFGSGRGGSLDYLDASFCSCITDCSSLLRWVEMAAIGQSVFSVILIFLFLLAIRNRFKIK